MKDLKNGQGEFTFIDGTKYTGKFTGNRMAEHNEYGILPLDSSQTSKSHTRESSGAAVNVVKTGLPLDKSKRVKDVLPKLNK